MKVEIKEIADDDAAPEMHPTTLAAATAVIKGTLKEKSTFSEMQAFLTCIEELLKSGIISKNVSWLLQDVVQTKEESFFANIMYTGKHGACYIDHLEEIISSKAMEVVGKLYADCSYERAKSVSLTDRKADGKMESDNLVYGEVEVDSFVRILRSIGVQRGGTFYDLGSGSGRPLFTARLIHDFDICIGLELLPNLHELALSVDDLYRATTSLPYVNVAFHCQDILEYDWSDGTVVFTHSTCFGQDLLSEVFEKAKDLKSGSYMITFQPTGIDYSAFELVKEMREEMSWGESDVFIFRRASS